MKRSGFKNRGTGLKSTTAMARGTGLKRGGPMKASRPKATPIRQSAKMRPCTIRLMGVCNGNPETVVWCHSNRAEHGKGLGLKAKDEHGAYGCHACHAVYDRQAPLPAGMTREYVEERFDAGMAASRAILRGAGLL